MLVLMKDAAEAVPPMDVEPGDGGWYGNRWGQRV